jgi:S-adenosylmethionine decarboxylase
MKYFICLLASICVFATDEQYQFKGKHFIASYAECDLNALSDVDKLREVMEEAARHSGATILQTSYHVFSPDGLTMVILLSESHASIHTYPEHRSCFVDLFTCGDHCSNEKFDEYLRSYLKPSSVHEKVLIRHEKCEEY